jgi:hypothetical protein
MVQTSSAFEVSHPLNQALPGEPFVAIFAVSTDAGEGAADEGERALRALWEVTEPLCDLSEHTAYTETQQFLDEDYADGRLYYWKSVNAPELSDKLIERLTEHAAAAPSPDSTIDVWYQGGAKGCVFGQEAAMNK